MVSVKEISKENQISEDFLRNLFELSKEEISKFLLEQDKSITISYDKIAEVFPIEILEKIFNNPDIYLKQITDYFSIKIGKGVIVRIKRLPEKLRYVRIRDIRSTHKNKLIQTEGIIKISSEVRPFIVRTKFLHQSCGGEFWVKTENFRIESPKKCPICGETSGKFIEVEHEDIDIQRLLIEETPDQIEKGEQPAQITVILTNDLCEPKMERKTLPGIRVKIIGIVRELIPKKNQAISDLYIEALHIEPVDRDIEDLMILPEDEKKIIELSKNQNILDIIAKSIAPGLYGKDYDIIKKAVALQLVSGGKKKVNRLEERRNIHILIIGDPGVGKSQFLRYITKLAPKSRYVVGVTASSVGLTASVRKDEILKGGWVLEAGALVLASGGIVCIDELDKLSEDELMALHEAMEQQTITIDKANIHVTLRTEASILAAANPKFGRWDKMKNITDQIDLPPTIINRFDLIFILIDEPNPEQDSYIVKEILKGLDKEEQPLIPEDLLTKYILYAKKIEPEWTDKAKEAVEKFYLELRKKASNNAIPITARQLQSIIRLAEASAKIRLSKIVTEDDVRLAEELMMYSLRQVGINPETKSPDIDILMTGISSTQRQRISTLIDIIKDLEKDFPNGVPYEEILNKAKEKGFEESKIKETLDKLLKEGYIYESGDKKYKVIR